MEVLLEGIHIGLCGETMPYINGNGFLVGAGAGGQHESGDKAKEESTFHSIHL
jgi:hypothetical protein